jgi:hypothetical protein
LAQVPDDLIGWIRGQFVAQASTTDRGRKVMPNVRDANCPVV